MSSAAELDGDELIARRVVDADPRLVWRAFTEPEHLAAFWGGHHAEVPAGSVTVDLRPGGGFELETRGRDGTGRRLQFVYEVIEEPSLLVFREPATGIITNVRLDPAETGTVVIIHQRRLPTELRTQRAASGLAGILERLGVVVNQLRRREIGSSPATEERRRPHGNPTIDC
jgi:uncharacterized protein YndB with AHSA1/START domain